MTNTQATMEFFNELAERWDAINQPRQAIIQFILARCAVGNHLRILDVACGTGVLFPTLLHYSPALLRAIDLSPNMVAGAQEKFGGHPNLQISQADFYDFEETGFDLLTVYNAYPHFMDKSRFATAARRCLRPGGRLIIAHGDSRETVNRRHEGKSVHAVSSELLPCADEIARLGNGWDFDVVLDSHQLYLLSAVAQ